MKVFIGSSSEDISREIAESVSEIIIDYAKIKKQKVESIPWWREDVFEPTDTYIESLYKVKDKVDLAFMVFTEDDYVFSKGKDSKSVRDNVLFEYGLFSGVLGRKKAIIIKYGNPKTPSDLTGVNTVELEGDFNCETFKTNNAPKIKRLLNRFVNENKTELRPAIEEKFKDILINIKKEYPYHQELIDVMLQISRGTTQSVDYMDDSNFIDKVTRALLKGCNAIYALDVIGPNGWLSPSTFRYLAPQLKAYLKNNTVENDKWNLKVSKELEIVIKRSIENAKNKGLKESITRFDNPIDFKWSSTEEFKLENIRILLWEERELLTPFAESIIAIHEAFYVPLFFIKKDKTSQERTNDYIIFKKNNGDFDGFLGRKSKSFRTETLVENGKEVRRLKDEFLQHLDNKEIMFAVDARKFIADET